MCKVMAYDVWHDAEYNSVYDAFFFVYDGELHTVLSDDVQAFAM